MKSRMVALASLIATIVASLIAVNYANAAGSRLSLPSTPVRIEAFNGTESYFQTLLTNVPSGYDVTNGTYLGWCVDKTAEMTRSPAIHEVTLYSSMNAPGNLASERWDLVNYVLNHKQGGATDIQQAIWHFVNLAGNYSPSSSMAWAIVNDTLANGSGFTPGEGQAVAVICLPKVLLPEPSSVQISIIEVACPVLPEFPSIIVVPLFIIGTLFAVLVHRRGRSAS